MENFRRTSWQVLRTRARSTAWASLLACVTLAQTGCSTLKSIFAVEPEGAKPAPISNPFAAYGAQPLPGAREGIVLRSRQGDRAVEVELPGANGEWGDIVVPLTSGMGDKPRSPASELIGGYRDRKAGISDREIMSALPRFDSSTAMERNEVERGLGLMESKDATPYRDASYLGAVDLVKQLYRSGRYEAALLELDDLLRAYPTDPRLYEMRGTLLDRVGRSELAIRSWNQSLRLDPQNAPLRKYVERKSMISNRMPASRPVETMQPEGGTR